MFSNDLLLKFSLPSALLLPPSPPFFSTFFLHFLYLSSCSLFSSSLSHAFFPLSICFSSIYFSISLFFLFLPPLPPFSLFSLLFPPFPCFSFFLSSFSHPFLLVSFLVCSQGTSNFRIILETSPLQGLPVL